MSELHGPQLVSTRRLEWEQLELDTVQELREADCETALEISSLDDLRRYLHDGPDQATDLRVSRLSATQLDPHLRQLKSFSNAITSASQYSPVACLVWGGVQAMVESASVSANTSKESLEIITTIQDSLPQFDRYLALFPGNYKIQWALQDIFRDFLTYCVTAAKYFRQGQTRNYFLQFFTTATPHKLTEIKSKIDDHIRNFEKEAALAHREAVLEQNSQVTRQLGANLTTIPESYRRSFSAMTEKVEFPVNTLAMQRNYVFTGRDDILARIDQLFSETTGQTDLRVPPANTVTEGTGSKGRLAPMAIISGIGGIGKTQIALEYAHRSKGKVYDAVFWLQAEHEWTLASTYADIADKLGLLDSETLKKDESQRRSVETQRAREWLEGTERRCLLIFDNVEDINDLSAYLPSQTRGKGDILVTTQKEISFQQTERFDFIPIKPLNRDDSARLLFRYLQREPKGQQEEDVARDLCDVVDGLPLAIATIGGYINSSGSDPQEYVKTLQTSANAWVASASGPIRQYERSLATVFNLALSELSPVADGVAGILAFLNPDHIPESIFQTAIERKTLGFLTSKANLLDAVRELRARQLIQRDTSGVEPYLSIHRTVQWNILLRMSQDKDHRWAVFERAFKVIRDVLPSKSPFAEPSPDKWPKFQKYGPHILSLRSHCLWPDPPILLPVNFAQVVSDMGTFMWHAGKLKEGEEALETAIEILDQEKVKDPDMRANVYELLAIMSSFEGVSERKRSMDLRHLAREARHKAFNQMPQGEVSKDDEIQAMLVESDVAYAYVQQENFDEAAVIMEEVVKRYRKWGSEDDIPYQYSQYYQLMAVCHMAAGNPARSIECISKCVEMLIKAGDIMHPMTQLMRFIAGYLTWHTGQKEEALKINQSVLEARQKVIGEFSHFTLESYSTTGRLLAEQGEYETARVYLDRCLERRKRALWNEEGVARAQFRYSQVLEKLGEHEQAKRMAAMAQEARTNALQKYPEYLPQDGDPEAIHDQMVSVWAGRFTGKMVQKVLDIPKIEDLKIDGPELGNLQEIIDQDPEFPLPQKEELGIPDQPKTVAEVVDILDPS